MNKFIGISLLIICATLVPGWLYASGNLPCLAPNNEQLIRHLKGTFVELSNFSYHVSHRTYEHLRSLGIEIPLSRNERLANIIEIRREVIEICDSIILDE